MELRNKVIVITGASSGIGREVAKIFSGMGARLVLLDRSQDKLNELADELKKANKDVIAVKTDVTDRQQVDNAVKKTVEAFSTIDVLINNAGMGYFGPIAGMKDSDFENIVQTNVLGCFYMMHSSLEYLKKSGGMIVNVTSGLSKRALPYLSVYAGTKAMLDLITDGVRMELKEYGIKVLLYSPTMTDTPFLKNSMGGREMPEMKMKVVKPQDVAGRMVKAIIKEKRRVIEGGRMLEIMNFLAPGLLDNIFYKAIVKKMKSLKE